MNTPPKIIKRNVKHVFKPEEIAALNIEFGQAYDRVKSVEKEFDSIKAKYKSMTAEAESRMETLRASINAGFDFRDKNFMVVMNMREGKKYFFDQTRLPDGELLEPSSLVADFSEPITDEDRQQELIAAEAKFEKRETIVLFDSPDDHGTLDVGRFEGKWFSALNVKIGDQAIVERLDSEQPCSKKRFDRIKQAVKFLNGWLDDQFDREIAKGFKNSLELIKAQHAEREE